MIPDSVIVLLLLTVVGGLIYISHLRAMIALAYLDGFIDGRRLLVAAESVEEVYDWAEDGL